MNYLIRSVAVGLLLVGLMSTATSVEAAVLRSGTVVSVPEDAHIDGDFYAAGNDVHISGGVEGDVYVLGGTVTINGPVTGDVVIAGGTVAINGEVGDDVRVVGGKATVANKVASDVLVLGGTLTILSTAHVGGDVLFYGGQAEISGEVTGAVHARSESLTVNAPVGSVDATLESTLVLGNEANVRGDLTYVSDLIASRSSDSVVTGAVHHKDALVPAKGPVESRLTFWLAALFSALVSVLLFRGFLMGLFGRHASRMGMCGVLGLGVLLITPLAFGLLLVSVLGALAGAFVLFFYLSLMVAALIIVQVFAGTFIAKAITGEYKVTWLWTIIGVAVTQGVLLIPVLGPLLVFVMFCITVGMVVYQMYLTFYAHA